MSVYIPSQTAAHEIGHNLGMDHDFATKHGGKTGTCNKYAGIMSYQTPLQKGKHWSTCSKKDFQTHYNRILAQGGTWCMTGILFSYIPVKTHFKVNFDHT